MAEWVRVAAVAGCPVGQLTSVAAGGEQIVLANVDGDVYALLDQCSHEEYPLSDGDLEGTDLVCMYHGARFDACTGKNKGLPAIRPVRSFPVDIRDGDVYVEV
ncbi:MAG: non-heme iron oxygenase ferredoxin subunit [Gemmatimonadetes bacterium]|nr:non-heme iron oxygenase ferredoxin subunit [Gemmatimonadota bacterium]